MVAEEELFSKHLLVSLPLMSIFVKIMVGRKYKKRKPRILKVEEPEVVYRLKPDNDNLLIFSSFEEAELKDLQQVARQTPEQRLRETVELILRVYGFTREQLKKRKPKDNLQIILYK